jgi:hypothetical protein
MKTKTDISNFLELRIAQMYVSAIITSKYVDGVRMAGIVRYGPYEVRLIDFFRDAHAETGPLWLELFDHDSKQSLDSYSGGDLEEAAQVAEELIAQARALSGMTSHDAQPN